MTVLDRLASIRRTNRIVSSRHSLLEYSKLTFRGKFEVNWHHELVCRELDQLLDDQVKRIVIMQPPQTGKSELVSRRLPAMYAGRHPSRRIIAGSYSRELATFHAGEVRRTIASHEHRQAFPGCRLKSRKLTEEDVAVRNTAAHFDFVGPNAGGFYRAVGIMGGIIGFGADLFIIDDPIKNREEAHSETYQQKLRAEFDSTIFTRMGEEAALVLMFQRWTDDDLVAYALEQAKKAGELDRWVVLELPALMDLDPEHRHPDDPREIGEALWPERYSAPYYERRKIVLPDDVWSSTYQQRPSREGGGMFRPKYWRRWRPETLPDIARQFISIDAGFKREGRSWVVMQVWGIQGDDLFLQHQTREHLSYVDTRDGLRRLVLDWPDADTILIEEAANGHALIDDLADELSGIEPVPPADSKVARASLALPPVRDGRVWIPDDSVCGWVQGDEGFVEELRRFPHGKFDDQVDAASQAINWWRTGFGGYDGAGW